MKKILLITSILSIGVVHLNAQDQKKLFQYNLELPIRIPSKAYEINQTLSKVGISIDKMSFATMVGLEYFFITNTSIELEAGMSINAGKNYRMTGIPATLRVRQNFDQINTSIGFKMDVEPVSLSVFDNQDPINLNSGIQSSFVQVYNSFWTIGIIATYDIDPYFRFNIGYSWQVGDAKWKSEYTSLQNSIVESNLGYAYVSVGYRFAQRNRKPK